MSVVFIHCQNSMRKFASQCLFRFQRTIYYLTINNDILFEWIKAKNQIESKLRWKYIC